MSKPCLSTWMLTIWHKKTMCFCFSFFYFFKNFMHIWFWSNPRFNQDLNKFQAWKWKRKPRSFLISHSKIYEAFGTYLKFPCLKPKTNSLHDWLHKTEFRVRGRYMICVWVEYVQTLFINLNMLMCFGFLFFWFFWILCP